MLFEWDEEKTESTKKNMTGSGLNTRFGFFLMKNELRKMMPNIQP